MLPGTMPPPRTRFSSPHARRCRGAPSTEIESRGWARAGSSGLGFESFAAFRTWNSSRVFQARQCGHWPAQRRDSPPHSRQTKVMVVLGMWAGPTLGGLQKIYKRGMNLFGRFPRYREWREPDVRPVIAPTSTAPPRLPPRRRLFSALLTPAEPVAADRVEPMAPDVRNQAPGSRAS